MTRFWTILIVIVVVAALFGVTYGQPVTMAHAIIAPLCVAIVFGITEFNLQSMVLTPVSPDTPPSLARLIDSAEDTPEGMVVSTTQDQKKIHQTNDKYDFLLSSQDYADKDQLYYVNKGDLIDKEWKDKFTILDTKHWKPYNDPPPVCLDKNEPCAPCPVIMHSPYLDLSQFRKTLMARA